MEKDKNNFCLKDGQTCTDKNVERERERYGYGCIYN